MIEFQQVSFAYRGAVPHEAPAGVHDVDLRVDAGTCVLVCGGSGCGKTTVTRLANGLAPSFIPGTLSGRVLVDGRDMADLHSWEVAAHVGSVFQNPRTQFFNVDSTGEVAFALESMAWPEEHVRARVHETMDELGLRDLADRDIFSLSGGEKQRIAYASVWAPHPANLVLDEPTSNLDGDAIDALRGYLRAARARGTAVLVAEHRLWWLAETVDEVVYLRDGRVDARFSGAEFRALPAARLRALGLRARDVATVRAPEAPDARARSSRACAAPPLLSLGNLHASYGKRPVLRGVEASVHVNEVVAIVGRNGAGKSTLCRTAVGLHREDAGDVLVDGAPCTPKERLRRAAMVFQDVNYQLFAESVEAEVGFGLEGGDRPSAERVRDILRDLGLDAFAERHPATLSGGQKQRLAVAACIASGKRLLVFDEPTSGLDFDSMRAVAQLVRALAAEGRAVLVVTHDLEFIACACDRALLVEDGRIASEAAVEGDLAALRGLMETAEPHRGAAETARSVR